MIVEFILSDITDKRVLVTYLERDDTGNERSGELFFKMPQIFDGSLDTLGVVLISLCNKKYSEIRTNIEITPTTVEVLSRYFNVRIVAPICKKLPTPKIKNDGWALSFSGGFDSLACLALMPNGVYPISLDLGGQFSREKVFFSKFTKNIVETNLVNAGFNRNGWLFMAAGAMLLRSTLGYNFLSFGNILEASRANISPKGFRFSQPPVFDECNLLLQPLALGLTEVSTTRIASEQYPELIGDSLLSLASPSDEKFYRKLLLLQTLQCKPNLGNLIFCPRKGGYNTFGKSFALDFLTPYFLRNLGEEITTTINSNIPDSVIRFSREATLSFYDRFDSRFLRYIDNKLKTEIIAKLNKFSILPYDYRDYEELFYLNDLLDAANGDINKIRY